MIRYEIASLKPLLVHAFIEGLDYIVIDVQNALPEGAIVREATFYGESLYVRDQINNHYIVDITANKPEKKRIPDHVKSSLWREEDIVPPITAHNYKLPR